MTNLKVLTLFSRLIRGEATEAERRAVDTLRGSPSQAEEFRRFERTMQLATALGHKQVAERSSMLTDNIMRQVRIESTGERNSLFRFWWNNRILTSVAVAMIALCVIILPRSLDHGGIGPATPIHGYPGVGAGSIGSGGADMTTEYNDTRVANSVVTILSYLEGSFGALVMVISGFAALICFTLGLASKNKKMLYWGMFFLLIGFGAFLMRSFMATFFNTESLNDS